MKDVFDRYNFLASVLRKARTRQAVLDVLSLPSSRGPELFNRDNKKPRGLSVEEAIMLSQAFGVPLGGESVSVEQLLPVLQVCLRHAPPSWTERDVQRLAGEIVFGLRFQRSFGEDQHSPNHEIADAEDDVPPKPHG